MTTTETGTTPTTPTEPDFLRGDINRDGEVGSDDAQLALIAYTEQFIGNPTGLSDLQLKAADVNEDGELSVEDAQFILIYYTERSLAGNDIAWDDLIKPKPKAQRPQRTVVLR